MKPPTAPRILLTGATGTLGHHVLDGLLRIKGASILALTRPSSAPTVRARNLRYTAVDFNQPTALAAVFRKFRPTAVIHCAAGGMIFPQVHWFQLIRFNVEATLRLFEQAAEQPGCHFLHVSTGLAYRTTGGPLRETDALENIHPYGATKAAADILLRSAAIQSGTPLTLFRPFSFTGLHDHRRRLFPSLLRAAAGGPADEPFARRTGARLLLRARHRAGHRPGAEARARPPLARRLQPRQRPRAHAPRPDRGGGRGTPAQGRARLRRARLRRLRAAASRRRHRARRGRRSAGGRGTASATPSGNWRRLRFPCYGCGDRPALSPTHEPKSRSQRRAARLRGGRQPAPPDPGPAPGSLHADARLRDHRGRHRAAARRDAPPSARKRAPAISPAPAARFMATPSAPARPRHAGATSSSWTPTARTTRASSRSSGRSARRPTSSSPRAMSAAATRRTPTSSFSSA